jgi:poly(A) polymerase
MQLSDSPLANGAREVVRILQDAGYIAYWAGGCVRDILLGREPKDYDIATDAHPDHLVTRFAGALTVGKAFGVITVPFGGAHYEIATFRHDHDYHDGRHPAHIVFSSPEEDAARRDFTVNALFYDPIAARLHDYVGGQRDLADRLLRCVGNPDARFAEDHLRLLRAVRFAATLDFRLDPATAAAIPRHAQALDRISAERIQVELTRTLLEAGRPGDALEHLRVTGILAVVLPEVQAMYGQAQPAEFHPEGDVFAHTVLMLNMAEHPTRELAYAVLLHDVGKPPTAAYDGQRLRFNKHAAVGGSMAEAILTRLKLPRRVIGTVVSAIAHHMRFSDVGRMKTSTLRRMIGAPGFDLELELHRLDCLASHGKLEHYRFLQQRRAEMEREPVLPTPWLNGRDLLAVGMPPGPAIGKWLRAAYDRQLDGADHDREAQLAWLQKALTEQATPPP